MKKTVLIVLLFAIALLIAACSAAATPSLSQRQSLPGQPPVPAAAPTAAANFGMGATDQSKGAGGSAESGATNSVPNAAAADRMIIYTTSLSLEVQDTEVALAKIHDVAASVKGFVSGENVARTSSDKLRGTVTVRIPAASLDTALAQFHALGIKVLNERKDSSDVTDQYTDLDARRRNLEATEKELTTLLATVRERSSKAEDILAVYRELTNIRTQIEQIKGQQNLLNNRTDLATVTIELIPHEDVAITQPDQWLPDQTAKQALKTLVRALQGFADLGINLVLLILPLVLVALLPLALLALALRWFVRRGRKPRAAATA